MAKVSRESFVAQSLLFFVWVLSMALANLYFKFSFVDLFTKNIGSGGPIAFGLTEGILVLLAYGAYRSYQRDKLLFTSSKSKIMNISRREKAGNQPYILGDSIGGGNDGDC